VGIAALILFLFFVVSFMASLQKSPTFDEPVHLYAGYSYLKFGDFRVNPEHPPLVKILAALPLLAGGVGKGDPTRAQRDLVQRNENYEWILADQFMFGNRHFRNFFVYPKIVMIALAAILGIFVFLWARDIYGLHAGIGALILYSLDPNIIAHASIIHTDLPFSLVFFAGTYFFWRASKRMTWTNLLFTAQFFALSAVTKFSFLAILAVWTILGTVTIVSPESLESKITSPEMVDTRPRKALLLGVVLTIAVIMAYVAIWAAYGFRFSAVPDETRQLTVDMVASKSAWLRDLANINSRHFFLPEAWVYGLAVAFRKLDRPAYLLGKIYEHGSLMYFPVAFVAKTPLPTLLLLCCGLGFLLWDSRDRRDHLYLLIPVVVFFSAAVWSRFNIGLRHILAIYPFLFVWLGGVMAAAWNSKHRTARGGVLLLGLWLSISSFRIYPDDLAFFNELVGGPAKGYTMLVDSNLDWGQDLKGLKNWMERHDVNKLRFAYFGTVDPFYYGINAEPAPGTSLFVWRGGHDHLPSSPYIAISATYLGGLYLGQKDTYAVFRGRTPVANIGYSILIYRDR
jgi:hypothetical protein